MMAPVAASHGFRLYRSGWSDDRVPWSDNQLWASIETFLTPGVENTIVLSPDYGGMASLYRVRLSPVESPEEGWVSYRARLEINNDNMGDLPLAWYVGAPSDWPSGLVRYPERFGPYVASGHGRGSMANEYARGVWTLAARRNS